jgi:hypothetical protein
MLPCTHVCLFFLFRLSSCVARLWTGPQPPALDFPPPPPRPHPPRGDAVGSYASASRAQPLRKGSKLATELSPSQRLEGYKTLLGMLAFAPPDHTVAGLMVQLKSAGDDDGSGGGGDSQGNKKGYPHPPSSSSLRDYMTSGTEHRHHGALVRKSSAVFNAWVEKSKGRRNPIDPIPEEDSLRWADAVDRDLKRQLSQPMLILSQTHLEEEHWRKKHEGVVNLSGEDYVVEIFLVIGGDYVVRFVSFRFYVWACHVYLSVCLSVCLTVLF